MELSLTSIKKSISALLGRYHLVLFIVVSLGGLALALYGLNRVVETSVETNGYVSTANDISFDETTIKRLQALKTTAEGTNKLQISGRANPFIE